MDVIENYLVVAQGLGLSPRSRREGVDTLVETAEILDGSWIEED